MACDPIYFSHGFDSDRLFRHDVDPSIPFNDPYCYGNSFHWTGSSQLQWPSYSTMESLQQPQWPTSMPNQLNTFPVQSDLPLEFSPWPSYQTSQQQQPRPSIEEPVPVQPILNSQSNLVSPIDPGNRRLNSASPSSLRRPSPSRSVGPPRSASVPPPATSAPRSENKIASTTSKSRTEEENQLLIHMRDEKMIPWKEVTKKFSEIFGRPYQMPALQMRYGRMKQKQNPWTEADTRALQLAQEYYATNRYDIIAKKMLEFGATEEWPARVCARKMHQLKHQQLKALNNSRATSRAVSSEPSIFGSPRPGSSSTSFTSSPPTLSIKTDNMPPALKIKTENM